MSNRRLDRVIIRDLIARGIIGVNEHERLEPRDILINLILYTDTHKAGESDTLSDCVDYSVVARQVRVLAESAARFTIEALAADIANLCLTFPRVSKVRVRVEKPGAVRFTRSVGVEIEREKST